MKRNFIKVSIKTIKFPVYEETWMNRDYNFFDGQMLDTRTAFNGIEVRVKKMVEIKNIFYLSDSRSIGSFIKIINNNDKYNFTIERMVNLEYIPNKLRFSSKRELLQYYSKYMDFYKKPNGMYKAAIK